MKFLLIFVGLLTFVAANDFESDEKILTEEEENSLNHNKNIDPEQYGLILNANGKKLVKNVVQNLPCGWPEYGIPPLAPYTKDLLEIHLKLPNFDSLNELTRFRLDGLNNMEIKKLKVKYTFKKTVKFHFIFPLVTLKAAVLKSDTTVDMKEKLGIIARYQATGSLDFALQNLELIGSFKYKMPWIFGSIKISDLKCDISLGSVRSNIGGIFGNGTASREFNKRLEQLVPAILNSQQKEISETIIEDLLPRINSALKGKKIWYILGQLINKPKKCIPEEAPWLAEQ